MVPSRNLRCIGGSFDQDCDLAVLDKSDKILATTTQCTNAFYIQSPRLQSSTIIHVATLQRYLAGNAERAKIPF